MNKKNNKAKTDTIDIVAIIIVIIVFLIFIDVMYMVYISSSLDNTFCATAICKENSCTIKNDKKTCKRCELYDNSGNVIWNGKCIYNE